MFSFQIMATNLSLRSLLDNDRLTGPNFDSWYRRLRIVLEHERLIYVINVGNGALNPIIWLVDVGSYNCE